MRLLAYFGFQQVQTIILGQSFVQSRSMGFPVGWWADTIPSGICIGLFISYTDYVAWEG